MEISSPLCITSRLLPGCRIGSAEISIEYATGAHSRQNYRYFIDLDNQEFSSDKLSSGAGGGSLQDGLESLLCFLGAFASAKRWEKRCKILVEGIDLFPLELADWAMENEDKIAAMALELQEHPNKLIVE